MSGRELDQVSGVLLLELHRRKVTQCGVQCSVVVYLLYEVGKPLDNVGKGSVVVQIGDWREASQPRALPKLDVNLSAHPAPIIRPRIPGSNGRIASDCGALANASSERVVRAVGSRIAAAYPAPPQCSGKDSSAAAQVTIPGVPEYPQKKLQAWNDLGQFGRIAAYLPPEII